MKRVIFFGLAFVFACSTATAPKKKKAVEPDDTEETTEPTADGSDNGSDGTSPNGTPTSTAKLASNIRISEIAVMQTVKIPLTKADDNGTLVEAPLNVNVISKRPALVRVYVTPDNKFKARPLKAELLLKSKTGEVKTMSTTKTIEETSSDADLGSTFNFDFTGTEVSAGTMFTARLVDEENGATAKQSDAQFPRTGGFVSMRVVEGRTLQVVLVPVRYDFDQSKRLPDSSPPAVSAYKKRMQALYPVADIDVKVRTDFPWAEKIEANGNGWPEILDAITNLRGDDNAADEVYYYGLFAPMASERSYCSGGCVLGLSGLVSTMRDSYMRASVGVGFIGPEDTMAHEIGHAHGRLHAPCGGAQGTDGNFPHARGGIGVWGWDTTTKQLVDPSTSKDIMGYCQPNWISDYTYRALFDRIDSLSAARAVSVAPRTYRRVLDNGRTVVAKNAVTLSVLPSGEERSVELQDAAGNVVGESLAHYYPFDHLPGGIYLYEEPAGAYATATIAGLKQPVSVDNTF